MMMIQVLKNEVLPNGARSIELATEKKIIEIYHGSSFTNFMVRHASQSARLGAGRTFHSNNRFAEALDAYKSSEVKAMIQTAIELAA
jgi:hypothetical protein